MVENAAEARRHALALGEELMRRRANDPLLSFKPHPKQGAFIDSVLQVKSRENWFIAANRAGKSDAGAFAGGSLARFGNEKANYVGGKHSEIRVRDRATSGWVVALDFPTGRDIVQPKYFDNGFVAPNSSHEPFIPAREIDKNGWRVGDQVLRLKNGSIIGFKSCESGPSKFQGAGKDWIHFDEEPPKDIYEESVIRVEGNKNTLIFGTVTILPPEGQSGGVSWLYTDMIQPWQRGEKPEIQLFGASIYDNPYILRSELDRLESIYPDGSVIRRIRLNGEWLPGLSGARAYVGFSPLNIGLHPPLDPRRPVVWALDFNVEPMCSIIGQQDGNLFRVYREIVLDEGNIPQACEVFYNALPRHQSEIWIYGDATGKRRTGQTGQSDYAIIQNEFRQYRYPLRIKVPETNPAVPDRINAMNVACNDRGVSRLLIDGTCKELIMDMEGVLRNAQGGIKKVTNKKDPYFRRTHTSDALGYWISYEAPVRVLPAQRSHGRSSIRIAAPGYGFSTGGLSE